MDRNAPKYLLDTPEKAYEESRELIKKWHNKKKVKICHYSKICPYLN